MTRLLAAVALAGTALLAAPASAGPLICVSPTHQVKVCDDGTNPLCVYGHVDRAAFQTAWC